MREIQCSFTKHNTAQLHQMTLERHHMASVDWLVQVMSWEAQEPPKEKSTHLESLVWEPMISKSLSARSYSLHIPKRMINIDRGNSCFKQSWNESLFVLNTD